MDFIKPQSTQRVTEGWGFILGQSHGRLVAGISAAGLVTTVVGSLAAGNNVGNVRRSRNPCRRLETDY